MERVIAYASRSLHPAERNDANYRSFKLELLAMKWAMSEKFKDHLWGAKVLVITDNNPLVHLHTAKLGAVEQQCVAQMANYDYQLQYRPGREHVNVDVLSRLPVTDVGSPALALSNETREELLVGIVEAPESDREDVPASWGWDPRWWRELQGRDRDLAVVRSCLDRGFLPQAAKRRAQTAAVRQLLGQRLYLKEGVICRSVQDPATRESVEQVVVPED